VERARIALRTPVRPLRILVGAVHGLVEAVAHVAAEDVLGEIGELGSLAAGHDDTSRIDSHAGFGDYWLYRRFASPRVTCATRRARPPPSGYRASGFFLARRAHALESTDARSAAAKENRQADNVLARFRGVRAERHGGGFLRAVQDRIDR